MSGSCKQGIQWWHAPGWQIFNAFLVTWQLLQHSPLLHLEPCVKVHLLQQVPPSLAHSWQHKDTTAGDPNFTTESCCPSHRCFRNLPPGCRSRTPLQFPQSHFHTQEGPTAARETVSSFKTSRDTHPSVSVGGVYLHRFVKETGSSTAVQEVMELLHVAVGELLGQVVTVNAGARSDKSRRKETCSAGQKQLKCNSSYLSLTMLETA